MNTWDPSALPQCARCRQELHLSDLVCPACHALVHAAELEALARQAKLCEQKSDFAQAHVEWSRSLTLLPAEATQTDWVKNHLRELDTEMAAAHQDPKKHVWAKRLGPLAPVALLLAKGKSLLLVLFKLKFLFSFLSFFGLYAMMLGWRYGLGLAVAILIHELGHYIDIKRRGLSAEMPVFLPGLGAYVKWSGLGVSRRQVAQISLAGPLAGWIAAACCCLLYFRTGDPLWAALARTGAVINVLNLIPVWMLDGAKAVDALGKVARAALLAATVAVFAYAHEPIFLFVGAGVGWRLFTKDKPEQDDWSIWLYCVALLVALAAVLHAVPAPFANGAAR